MNTMDLKTQKRLVTLAGYLWAHAALIAGLQGRTLHMACDVIIASLAFATALVIDSHIRLYDSDKEGHP